MIRKVKEMNNYTDAKTAVVGIFNGRMFWYDEAGVLTQLGIAHEPHDGLTAETSSCVGSFSSAESVASTSPDPYSLEFASREGSSVSSERYCDIFALPANAKSSWVGDESLSTTDMRGHETTSQTSIEYLDLDFFGLEKDSGYGV